MTSPFFVRICSVCAKRVNVESRETDEDGQALHEECLPRRGHSKKSESHLALQTVDDVHES